MIIVLTEGRINYPYSSPILSSVPEDVQQSQNPLVKCLTFIGTIMENSSNICREVSFSIVIVSEFNILPGLGARINKNWRSGCASCKNKGNW